MDPELTALASSAATTVVKALTTAAWEQATKAIGALWRRAHPDRAETVEAELTEAHEQLIVARDSGDGQTEEDLLAAWRSRLNVHPVAFSPDGKTLATANATLIGQGAQLRNVGYLVDFQRELCAEVGGSPTRHFWAQYVPPGPTYRNICS